MRKLKDALRLKFEGGQSHRQIADALGISKAVVTKYAGLAVAAALDWQSIAPMDEATLERRLLASPGPNDTYSQANWQRIWKELLARRLRVGKERARKLMALHVIKATAKSAHDLPVVPNTVWTADITSPQMKVGWT